MHSDFYHTNVTKFFAFFIDLISSCPQDIKNSVEEKFRNLSVHKVCEDLCPVECHSIRFKTRVTQLDKSHKNDKRATIGIFYENLNVRLITEIPMFTTGDLVSSIGGILGLYLGISMICIAEIFMLVAKIISIIFLSFKNVIKMKNTKKNYSRKRSKISFSK